MGATIFTNQAVNVLQTASGPGFLLFEETYEQNCYPHTPRWGCVGIGRRDNVLRSIFNGAASTESGLFRPRSGATTAEAYIPRWDRALKNALSIQSRQIRVGKHTMPMPRVGETLFPPMRDEVDGPFDPSQAKDWDDGKPITLDLESDFDTIVWLWRTKRLSLWKVFKSPDLNGNALDMSGEIFYPAASKKQHRQLPEFVRLFDSDSQLYLKDGTLLVAFGNDYEVMGNYVSGYAETEIWRPGHWKSNLRAYRKHIDSSPVLDQSLVLSALVPMNCQPWQLEWITRVQQLYPNGVHLGSVTDRSDRYTVTQCPEFRIVS
jgi:hypothetical protein